MSSVVPFEADSNALAISASLFGDILEDFGGVSRFPTLSLKGRQFTVHRGREAQLLTRKNADGDLEQVSSINAVIVRTNLADSRAFYLEGFKEGGDSRPVCFSDDDVTPDADSMDPQAKSCAMCPHNAWGSKKDPATGEPKGKSCGTTRRIAVAPLDNLDDPMLLRVPTTSIKTLKKYIQLLTTRAIAYPAVITRISFTPLVAYPSIEFAAKELLSAEDATRVHTAYHSELVQRIIGIKPVPSTQIPQVVAQVPVAPPVAAPPVIVVVEGDEEELPVVAAVAKPAKKSQTRAVAVAEGESSEDTALRKAFTAAIGDDFDDVDI